MKCWILAALAAGLLSGCGRDPVPMGGKPVSYWQAILDGNDARARKKAVFKLGNLGSAEAWPIVLGALRDRDPRVRAEAVQAVLKFGPTAAEAVPVLQALERSDTDAQVRSFASQVLARLPRDYAVNK